ncbi:zinc transporter ZupT [Desulfuribacillus stibiiarsenatis]|uniref:Zinc transporter ZupT n=1 Tax=Desulfuribacillus stibiiarsenatis TaxID=1390249 RepID=A0A1E5L7F5_9FIRM|nr:zinc transporter ZupT [Desulfuribacillus stibiiarsenatis]OEH86092.1 zinc transporter ZupT [Desulfuribacillus stibiiarsenatis]
MFTPEVLFALGITTFAGLSTGIGGLIAFFTKGTTPKFLAGSLGFSAGVMLYVSMIEIFPKANEAMSDFYGETFGYFMTTVAFFAGMAFIAIIDKLVPSNDNPHELNNGLESDMNCEEEIKKRKFYRLGIFSAIAITIHNFPEGIATFMATLQDPMLGVTIAIAIAIHNIPEGIAVSVPLYYATGSKKKALALSFSSGLAEPIGALLAFFVLMQFINDAVFGFVFASVAGIMVFISLDQLLPTAEKYGEHHVAMYGLVAGMVLMAASLVIFA